jgi:hypothetical protein
MPTRIRQDDVIEGGNLGVAFVRHVREDGPNEGFLSVPDVFARQAVRA